VKGGWKMKKTVLILMAIGLLIGTKLYAADGNLIVEGDATIGGNVGIGTSTPDYRLTVQGENGNGIVLLKQNGEKAMLIDHNAADEGRIKLYDYSGNISIQLAADSVTYFKSVLFNVIGLHGNRMFTVNPDTEVSYFETGNVGIGTTNPLSKLAVNGLPNTPPDSSGIYGIVCITNNGNMWVDDDGAYDCQ